MESSAAPVLSPIRVFLIPDIRLYGEAVAQFLAGRRRLQVVGIEAPRDIVLEELRDLQPDIILLDVPARDSVRDLEAIVPLLPAKVVAIGLAERDVIACAEAGIAGFVPRQGSLVDLVTTIESVAADEMPCSPRIAASLIRRLAALASERPNAGAFAELTSRESEIVELIDNGLSNKEIARRLCIELSTVKNHVHNILAKLGTHRRGEAAARFRHRGGYARPLRPPRRI